MIAGLSPDELSLEQRLEFAGKWVAIELYNPTTLPLRLIAAVGDSAAECAATLARDGRDPARFEYMPLKAPY